MRAQKFDIYRCHLLKYVCKTTKGLTFPILDPEWGVAGWPQANTELAQGEVHIYSPLLSSPLLSPPLLSFLRTYVLAYLLVCFHLGWAACRRAAWHLVCS